MSKHSYLVLLLAFVTTNVFGQFQYPDRRIPAQDAAKNTLDPTTLSPTFAGDATVLEGFKSISDALLALEARLEALEVVTELFTGSNDPNDSLPISRIAPLLPNTGVWSVFNGDFPVLIKEEREVSLTGSALNKWRKTLVKESDRVTKAAAQAANSALLLGLYEVADSLVSTYNSPFATNGTGAKHTHGAYADSFDTYTDVGDLSNLGASNDSLYIGHLLPSMVLTTTNNGAILANDTDTEVYNLSTSDGTTFTVGYAGVIWTPEGASCSFADEVAAGVNGFTDGEAFAVTARNATSVTIKQLTLPSGQQWGSMATGGGSVAHASGSCVMPIIASQGSNKELNMSLNISEFAPADSAGRTWNEAFAMFMADGADRDVNGNAITIRWDFIEFDVSQSYVPSGQDIDINFDGVIDEGIVGNENVFEQGWNDLYTAMQTYPVLAGLPVVTAGTNEHFRWQGSQNEHLGSESNQKGLDEEAEYSDWIAQVARSRMNEARYAQRPWYNSIVHKKASQGYPDDTASASNDAWHMWFATCALTKTPCAPRNFNQTGQIDNWPGMGALLNGVAIANTPANEASIQANLGWLGKPVGDLKNVSGIDFSALTPTATYDFEDAATTDILGWNAAGGNQGALVLAFDAANDWIEATGYNATGSYASSRIQTPEVYTSGDAGKDLVVRVKMSSNAKCLVSVQVANQEYNTYIDTEPMYINYGYTLTAADVTSGFDRRVKFNIGRCHYPGNTTEFRVHKVETYIGDNIDPNILMQEFENGFAIGNGTSRAFSLSIPADATYQAPDLSAFTPNQQASFVTNGQTFDDANPFNLPAFSGYVLWKQP